MSIDHPTETSGHSPRPSGVFQTTQWTNVIEARADSASALETLCATYRPALVAWLRGRGESPQNAEDLVQGFFEQLLKREFLRGVARENGRFRTFLLTALQRHLIDEHRRTTAAKRGGGKGVASLDETNEEGDHVLDPASQTAAPDEAFDVAWARALLARALAALETECGRLGHIRLCLALQPVMFADETAPAYAQIATDLGMTEAAVKMAAMRLRQRLKALIREQVLATVADRAQLEDELAHLRNLFSKAAA
jgi:RNA polymerase sigma-70 factor (ECF subfamily)